jgi:hypothetical protein
VRRANHLVTVRPPATIPLIITMIVALASTKLTIMLGHDVGPFHLGDVKRLGLWGRCTRPATIFRCPLDASISGHRCGRMVARSSLVRGARAGRSETLEYPSSGLARILIEEARLSSTGGVIKAVMGENSRRLSNPTHPDKEPYARIAHGGGRALAAHPPPSVW